MPSTILSQPLHLSAYLFCLVALALFHQNLSQIDHARQRVGMLPAQHLLPAPVPDDASLLPTRTCPDPSVPPLGCLCSSVCEDAPRPAPSPSARCLTPYLFCLLILTLKPQQPRLKRPANLFTQLFHSTTRSLDLGYTLLMSAFSRFTLVGYQRQLRHH